MTVISAQRRLRPENNEFKTNLDYTVFPVSLNRLYRNPIKQNNNKTNRAMMMNTFIPESRSMQSSVNLRQPRPHKETMSQTKAKTENKTKPPKQT